MIFFDEVRGSDFFFFFTHVHYSNIVQLLIYVDLYIRLWNEHILADLYCDVLLVAEVMINNKNNELQRFSK